MTTPEDPTQRAPHNPAQPPPSPYGAPGPSPYGASGQPAQQWPQAGPVYPPAGPAQSPYSPPPGSGKSGRTVTIVVGAVVLAILLVCGGTVTLVVLGIKNVSDAVDESISEFDTNRPGGRDNPIEVEIGEEFEIDGVSYAAGWRLEAPQNEYDGDSIAGLRGTNERDDESSESVSLSFTFIGADDVEIGEVRCRSDGTISHGNTEELDCDGNKRVGGAERVEVAASY
ncbi:hypothetical protein JK386_01515 [Nocardioides sp. zg-536]|uniref:Uncharacterized protein n=1 Tax=Nocardioides faecalis TaxID=2803858 RepID=A0A938Y5E4_9ACTN|nr:hypothetical protein [Nocardioides faecalis]MBM9458573.1 hypothetical protein [Nocardioides faecalis]QVI58575.1 hypothetical protein KG111_16605 [Nocardioides faecalis]